MKRENGRMSKKDRRACEAFGVSPVTDTRAAMALEQTFADVAGLRDAFVQLGTVLGQATTSLQELRKQYISDVQENYEWRA